MDLREHHTNNLTFNTHTDFIITNKTNRTLGFLLRNCTPDIKDIAYKKLVRPTLQYCTTEWDPCTKHNMKLEQVSTRVIRFITHNYARTSGTTHIKNI